MVAHLLVLPSEAYLAELATEVDVDAIHNVREFLRHYLAEKLEARFLDVYESCRSDAPYVFTASEVARRVLGNTVLNYLACLDKPEHWQRLEMQYDNAVNMTDSSASLRALVNNPSTASKELRDRLLARFYDKWQHESLVVEQWFLMQSAAMVRDNLPQVLDLLNHPAFDIRNPNKVRSVIGAFCFNNAVSFHKLDGSGYEFLVDQVILLNGMNPQIASRLLTPLTRWKKHTRERQDLMQTALRRILAAPNLSPDVYEVVSKSLQ
jgi:aminopeptidase N